MLDAHQMPAPADRTARRTGPVQEPGNVRAMPRQPGSEKSSAPADRIARRI
ncbi:MAG: hypothetical protein NW206_07840 [Hyphomonadaceae bacterium]|nr:hypothetical protein [Hyphomonadaceae bacterium]